MKGYKGFDKDLKCRGFQYEVGKDYEQEGYIKACSKGFHFCENPLNVFDYYPPAGSRFCEVEGSGEMDQDGSDSKVATSKIHIGVEIGLKGIIEAGIKFILDKVDWKKENSTTGNQAGAQATGNQAGAQATGYRAAAQAEGDWAVATAIGDYGSAEIKEGKKLAEGCAIALGIEGKAKGVKGCWITLAEWEQDEDWNWHRTNIKTKKVDGKKIKENTFYMLKNNKFVEVE